MKLDKAPLLRAGARLVLRDKPKRLLTKAFGQKWRGPLLRFSAFGPLVSVLEGETVVLGGCHRFDTLRSFYDAVGPAGRVVAIEANEQNVARLKQRIAEDSTLGSASNVIVIAKGLWNDKGKVTFIANEGEYAGLDKIENPRLREFPYHKVGKAKRIEIEVDSLDNILREAGVTKVDFVLLTINDAELMALDGVDGLLEANPDVRFLVHSQSPYPGDVVKKKLADRGYGIRAYPIRGSQLEKIYAFRTRDSRWRTAMQPAR